MKKKVKNKHFYFITNRPKLSMMSTVDNQRWSTFEQTGKVMKSSKYIFSEQTTDNASFYEYSFSFSYFFLISRKCIS